MDGLPSSEVWSVAQDGEGYLWLGTNAGLVRFDGVQFVSWVAFRPAMLPNKPVRALYLSRDGSLWIGFGDDGGVSQMKAAGHEHGWHVQNYAGADGLGRGAITGLVEDHGGTIWAGNQTGLYSLSGDRWSKWTGPDFPDGPVHSAYVDRRGQLLVSTSSGVLKRSSEEGIFHRVSQARLGDSEGDVVRSISVDAAGRIWMTDPAAAVRTIDQGRVVTPLLEKGRGARLLHDTVGNLWVGTWGQGLWRVQRNVVTGRAVVERSTALTGLMGNGVNSLLQDREDNIWAGTLDGLNRLTPHKATPITNLGLVAGVELTGDSVWVATAEELTRFQRGVVRSWDVLGAATQWNRSTGKSSGTLPTFQREELEREGGPRCSS
jgi:ligand-binding sensor domain-containing protein